VGKGTALKVLKAEVYLLALLGQVDTPMKSVIHQATGFMSACFSKSMSKTRFRLWASKTGSASSSSALPKLCSLAPTNKVSAENVKRAHYQANVWRSLETQDPPELHPELYGWVRDTTSKSLQLITLPTGIKLTLHSIMRLIRCGCKNDTPYSTQVCGCMRHDLGCSVLCACSGLYTS
jgi:hypothetical protein